MPPAEARVGGDAEPVLSQLLQTLVLGILLGLGTRQFDQLEISLAVSPACVCADRIEKKNGKRTRTVTEMSVIF